MVAAIKPTHSLSVVDVATDAANDTDQQGSAPRSALERWNALGQKLIARGAALDAALVAAEWAVEGVDHIDIDEEDAIAAWFVAQVKEAISRGGRAAVDAIWNLLVNDIATPKGAQCRSSVFEEVGSIDDVVLVQQVGGEAAYIERFLVGCDHYARVLVAQSSEFAAEDIRKVMRARGAQLDDYAPFRNPLDGDVDPDKMLADATSRMATLLRSPTAVASVVADYGFGMSQKLRETALSIPYRLGLVAWFAHRGLRKARSKSFDVLSQHSIGGAQ